MHLLETCAQAHAFRPEGSVGLVPTMGALHEGHAQLIQRARGENEHLVVSIFVNPLQFTDLGDCDDYRLYPRNLERDLELLKPLGVDAVFAPSVEEMYPSGPPEIWLRSGHMGSVLEGAARPGHFDGVLTVVDKLFNLLAPTRAYFGEKDAQQLAIIERMVRDTCRDLDIVRVPIIRGADGLAESSRNQRLSPAMREHALALPRALESLAQGTPLIDARTTLATSPGVRLDHLERIDSSTLRPAEDGDLAIGAIFVGDVRLIDNRRL